MDNGNKQMGTSKTPKDQQDNGEPESTFGSVEEFFKHIRRKFRELDMADGTESEELRQSNHRRKQSLQRSLDQAIQSIKKASEKLQKEINFNRNTKPPRTR